MEAQNLVRQSHTSILAPNFGSFFKFNGKSYSKDNCPHYRFSAKYLHQYFGTQIYLSFLILVNELELIKTRPYYKSEDFLS